MNIFIQHDFLLFNRHGYEHRNEEMNMICTIYKDNQELLEVDISEYLN